MENVKYHIIGIALGGLVFVAANFFFNPLVQTSLTATEHSRFTVIDRSNPFLAARLSAKKAIDPSTEVAWAYSENELCHSTAASRLSLEDVWLATQAMDTQNNAPQSVVTKADTLNEGDLKEISNELETTGFTVGTVCAATMISDADVVLSTSRNLHDTLVAEGVKPIGIAYGSNTFGDRALPN